MILHRHLLAFALFQCYFVLPHGFLHSQRIHAKVCSQPLLSLQQSTMLSRKSAATVLLSASDEPSGNQKEIKSIGSLISELGKSFGILISELGKSFKDRAEMNKRESRNVPSRLKAIQFSALSSFYYVLFIISRAYRGFFILVPAIFGRVYSKLETAVDNDLKLEDDNGIDSVTGTTTTWRTQITVSILACIVTFSYFLGGALRVLGKFFRTVTRTHSVTDSFAAAASEVMEQEGRMQKRASHPDCDLSSGFEASP